MQDHTELQKALAKQKQHALQYARERDQWSCRLEQQRNEEHSFELGELRKQLAAAEAKLDAEQRASLTLTLQRDEALQQVEELKSSLATARSRLEQADQQSSVVKHYVRPVNAAGGPATAAGGPVTHNVLNQVAIYVGGAFLTIAALFTSLAFQDAQSNVVAQREPGAVAVSALESTQLSVSKTTDKQKKESTDKKKPPPTSDKGKTRVAGTKTLEHRQWGPALLVADPGVARSAAKFDPLVQKKQKHLLTLGFDIGKADGLKGLRTRQALAEFESLYLPGSTIQLTDDQLSAVLGSYANMVRNDADRFGMDRGVLAAIRLSSVRTGVDFSYLMKLAATESNFEPEIKATGSSATGLYQFTRDTWLNTIKKHGASYALNDYAEAIEFYVTRGGYQRPMVKDKALYKHLLELRKNPRLSAMMVAETVRDNQRRLSYSLDREPTQTDLYLTHFLGTDGAIAFLKALEETPDIHAGKMFPAAARSNQDIFHAKPSDPRTVDEVYELFGNKFSTSRYDDLALN